MLILLMLANTSMAAEILIHNSHGHEAVPSHQSDMVEMPDLAHDSMSTHVDHELKDQPAAPDCHCDDACCVGSSGFTSNAGSSPLEGHDAGLIRLANLYQSIFLELIPPPPNG